MTTVNDKKNQALSGLLWNALSSFVIDFWEVTYGLKCKIMPLIVFMRPGGLQSMISISSGSIHRFVCLKYDHHESPHNFKQLNNFHVV